MVLTGNVNGIELFAATILQTINTVGGNSYYLPREFSELAVGVRAETRVF